MSVVNAWQGAATPSGFRVRSKVTGASTRLLVADNPSLTGPVAFGPVVPTADGIATLDASGLDPVTRYWWAVEDDSVVDTQFPGTMRTFPVEGEPASYTFAAATCAGSSPDTPGVGSVLAANRLSNHQVFETIRARGVDEDWLFFAHIGDMNYYDLGSGDHGIVGGGSLANYRRSYDDVLLQPHQHALYRELPLVYSCGAGGHDWGQPIGLASTLPARDTVLQVWRERVPDYPTADPATNAGTYRSFVVGRILFLVTDENADRDPDADVDDEGKTKLGAAQLAWLEQTLTTTGAKVAVWLSGAQWQRDGSANWGRYTTERALVQQMLGDLGWLNRMVFITGDRHALQIVSPQGNPFGGFPLWHFASLDCPSAAALPTSLVGNNRYGTVQVTDTGSNRTLIGTGWVGTDTRVSGLLLAEPGTIPLGPQHPDGLVAILQEAADADRGVLTDDRSLVGALAYRPGRLAYNQAPALELDYDAGHLAPPLDPTIDDQGTRNDVTATRRDGGEARAVDQASIDTVGRVATGVTLNVMGDGMVGDQAGWLLHLGADAGTRFPQLTVDLAATPGLVPMVDPADIGDRTTIANLPPQLTPDLASLLVLGYTEVIGPFERKITFNCTPEEPYHIAEMEHADYGIIGSATARVNDLSGSGEIDTTQTDITLAVRADGPWVHQVDWDILIGGERMTVTAVAAAVGVFPLQLQDITVVRSVNSVVKAHTNGTPVHMFHKSYIGL